MADISVTLNIPLKRIADLLCCGFEGGIGYWGRVHSYVIPTVNINPWAGQTCDYCPKYIRFPLSPGGAVIVEEFDDFKTVNHTLDLTAIERGLKVMQEKYPRHFADFLSENDDATTGDIFLQCCLFGEIVYG